ncbi:hypothetical protein I4U23_005678 [Adineta vaga]|nr:hypothetical protein I4U23_005678 [Adineta vaga]
MSFLLLFIIFIILICLTFQKWIIHSIQIAKAYNNIPCSPTKLPILGDLLTTPLDSHKFTKKLDEYYERAKNGRAKWKDRRHILTPVFHDKDLLNHSVDIFNEQATILIQRLASLKPNKEVNLYKYIVAYLLLKQMYDEQLTLFDIQEEVDTFMFEGHDNAAAAIHFTCFTIASYPEVQRKLHEEIDRVFGNDYDRPCTMEDLNELEYLECVLKESLRLYPSVPFIAREVQEDFMFHDHKVLKDSSAFIFIYYIHRDPKHFPDPNRFDPDKFLPENSIGRSPAHSQKRYNLF